MELTDTYRYPGQLIQELLDARGWTQRILAVVLGVDETGLNKILAGKRQLDAPLALQIGDIFDVDPAHLLDIQKRYDLALAKLVSRPNPALASRAKLFGNLPVSEMVKRGWLHGITDIKDVPAVEKALLSFFGAADIADIHTLAPSFKKTGEELLVTPTQIAWLYRVKQIAADMMASRFSQSNAETVVEELRGLRGGPTEARRVPKLLSEAGIRYAIVESLPSAKVDGVCFWLNDSQPVVGMSLRYDRIDNFWFVLRHELEHVIQGHGKGTPKLDAELEGERAGSGPSVSAEERVANEAAANFCVDQASLSQFIARKAPFFAERDIVGFAKTLRVHPGLVAGQLQRRLNRYDRFRNHLVKIRTSIAPAAVVDGWGDVVPMEA